MNKYYLTEDDDIDTWELQVWHQSNDSTRDILITGIQNEFGKCYTQPLLFPGKICCASPLDTININVDRAFEDDEEFRKDYDVAVACKVHEYHGYQLHLVRLEQTHIMRIGKEHRKLLFAFDKIPHQTYIQAKTSINKVKAETKRQLWHARLDYQLDDAMTTASKYIDGVQNSSHRDPVLDACSTCIQAKQTKNADTGTSLKATVPFQGVVVITFEFMVKLAGY